MRIPVRFLSLSAAIAAVCLAASIPAAAFAAGGSKPAAAATPDTQKKVWTNDDVERLNPDFDASRPSRPDSTASTAPVVALPSATVQGVSVAVAAALEPQQDPRWYAQQSDSLDAELAGIESQEAELRNFRATSTGLPTGLVLGAPCEGITTDNRIAQLEARRQEIFQQMDDLGDLARQNGLPPGILVEGRGRVEIVSEATPEELKADAIRQVRDGSAELAQVRGTVAGMQDAQAAQRMTLLQPVPGQGGNMTTDLLDQLYSRADALQNQISNAQGVAQSLGVAPGDVR
jgi:hypothetical protein